MMCRVILCNRQAQRDSNLCPSHFKQLVQRVLDGPKRKR